MKIKKQNILFIVLIAIIIFATLLSNGLLSITKTVSQSTYDFNTINEAKASCEATKQSLSGSQDCGPCLVMCPKAYTTVSGSQYTVKYPTDNTRYSGTYFGVSCDFVGSTYVKLGATPYFTETSGGLLEVKSFCKDTVKVCEKQYGSSTLLSVVNINGGMQYNYVQTIENRDCTTNKLIDLEPAKKYYEIKCNSGYYLDGKSFTDSIYSLGKCVQNVVTPTPNDLDKSVLDNNTVIIPSGDLVIGNPVNQNPVNQDATPSDNVKKDVSLKATIINMFDFENNFNIAVLSTVLSVLILLGSVYLIVPKKYLSKWGLI